MSSLRVMGIDPGLARMGYGILDSYGNQLRAVIFGCLETPANTPLAKRLSILFHGLQTLLEQYQPQVMAVEELFFNRNTTTAFTVGQARGVAILAGYEHQVQLAEYTPMQVKLAVTGYGRADKVQVQTMVKTLLSLPTVPKPDDTADALAVAITHAHMAPFVAQEERIRRALSGGTTP
ncbi:crossover junction endodeoxyribonuclease RuvC [Alicyclobacillus tengchongensis]|uniref:Crossover junction endodeoxyribonuclease RuvC n=1 Tax=Alicyclobacillus tolerans TaxID=90970 RepID=A0ABT9LSL0_9BACL|nr:crossover junction endodeoxyribonuclease RuvC [Alicyclobacillus tengchongensis]